MIVMISGVVLTSVVGADAGGSRLDSLEVSTVDVEGGVVEMVDDDDVDVLFSFLSLPVG